MTKESHPDPSHPPSRWMALDVGTRSIGVAITDPLRISARPLAVLKRSTLEQDLHQILELVVGHHVCRIVVGRPLHLSGEESPVLARITPLYERLKTDCGVQVRWAEERLSSKEAETVMRRAGLSPRRHRARRDAFAAALILTWYLEEQRD